MTAPNSDGGAFGELFGAESGQDLDQLMADLDVDGRGEDLEACNKHVHLAAQAGSVAVVQALLHAGASPNGFTSKLHRVATPLTIAIASGHCELAAFLLQAGANPNLTNTNLVNSLHVAAMQPSSTPLQLLLALQRSAVDPRDINRWTPLMFAAWHGRDHCARLLLDHGCVARSIDLPAVKREEGGGAISDDLQIKRVCLHSSSSFLPSFF